MDQVIPFTFSMISSAILAVVLILLLIHLGSQKPKGYPPGPNWWPVFGSAFEVRRLRKETGLLFQTFTALFKTYGPVVGLKIGKDRIVVLNGYESMRSMLTNEDCDGRPTGPFYETRTWGQRRGILLTDGPLWVEQRRFSLRHLREFGFGRTTMAYIVEDEAIHLVEYLKKLLDASNSISPTPNKITRGCRENNGQIYPLTVRKKADDEKYESNKCSNLESDHAPPCDTEKRLRIEDMYMKAEDYAEIRRISKSSGVVISVCDTFGVTVLNTLWRMMAGKRFNTDDKDLMYFQRILSALLKEIDMVGCLFSHFPILRYLAPEISGYKHFVRTHQQIWKFLNDELKNHKNTFNPDEPRDLMDSYLSVLETEGDKGTFSESQLLAICMDLFMAGSETTSKVLNWCFLYLIIYPNVQRKAQEEIDSVISRDKSPTLSDRPRMPYIEATVLESVRLFMGRTMSVPHRALRDTDILGHRLPKDTMIVANFNTVLMDESWGDPDIFRPDRFINDEGKITIPDQYIPFSFGRHRCMGETLAKSNLFVIIATLLHKFTFSVVPGEKMPPLEIIDGVTPSPKPFRALVSVRQ